MQIFSGKTSTHILRVDKSQGQSRFKVELSNKIDQKLNKSVLNTGIKKQVYQNSPKTNFSYWQRLFFKKNVVVSLNNNERLSYINKFNLKLLIKCKSNYEFKRLLNDDQGNENPVKTKNIFKNKLIEFGNSKKEHVENLAFYPFFQSIFKISYVAGWLFMFFVRLIYFTTKMAFSGTGGYLKYLSEEYIEYKKYKEQTKKGDQNMLSLALETVEKPKKEIEIKKIDFIDLNAKYNVNKNKSYVAPVSFVVSPPKRSKSEIIKKKLSFSINFPKFSLPKFFLPVFHTKKSVEKLVVRNKENNKKLIKALKILKKEKKEQSKERQNQIKKVNHGFLKPAFIYMFVLFSVIIPLKAFVYYKDFSTGDIKGRVLGATVNALVNIKDATKSAGDLNFELASQDFAEASQNFSEVKSELDKIDGLLFSLASLAPNPKIKMASEAKNIVLAGQISSEMGKDLSLAINSFFSFKEIGLLEVLKKFSLHTKRALSKNVGLMNVIKDVDLSNIPEEYRESFISLTQKTEFFSESLSEIVEMVDKAILFLGDVKDTRYLLVFQNNTELRASGGFVGSYALIDFSEGKVKNLEVPGGGSYDTEAGMFSRIKAPEPMQLISTQWFFWDANWWPDWEMSAKKLAWFLEKSDGPTVDGVISLTPTVVEKLLGVVGAIDLTDEYGVVVNANNFWQIVQSQAEQKQDVTNTPKKIIGDLIFEIIEVMPERLNQEMLIEMLKIVNESFSEKHILFYLTDPDLNKKIEELGWDGKIKNSLYDYLMVVNTNIAGGKSDKVIRDNIVHKSEVRSDGSIVVNLEISRTHTGNNREGFTGVRNNSWLRVYVPKGAKLISAHGFTPINKELFEIPDVDLVQDEWLKNEENEFIVDKNSGTRVYIEKDKTVFANWLSVDPGEKATVNLKYQLPFKLQLTESSSDNMFESLINKSVDYLNPDSNDLGTYSLMVQKQPGTKNIALESQLSISSPYNLVWKYPNEFNAEGKGWQISTNLNKDKYFAIVLEKKKE